MDELVRQRTAADDDPETSFQQVVRNGIHTEEEKKLVKDHAEAKGLNVCIYPSSITMIDLRFVREENKKLNPGLTPPMIYIPSSIDKSSVYIDNHLFVSEIYDGVSKLFQTTEEKADEKADKDPEVEKADKDPEVRYRAIIQSGIHSEDDKHFVRFHAVCNKLNVYVYPSTITHMLDFIRNYNGVCDPPMVYIVSSIDKKTWGFKPTRDNSKAS